MAAAGTPEEAGARRWLQAQGGAVKCVRLSHSVEWEGDAQVPGRDHVGVRLSTLLVSLPALASISLDVDANFHSRPTAAAMRASLAGAARAIGRCSSLQQLRLRAILLAGQPDQLPEALVRELARAHTLIAVDLCFRIPGGHSRRDWPATFSLAHLVAGLAGLSRLRTLSLTADWLRMEAMLPASVSCLAQLTSLTLSGFHGLRCVPGWARLPALARLHFQYCAFAGGGEGALPGMDALVALTSLSVEECHGQQSGLRALPTSLWRLSQLCSVVHLPLHWGLSDVPRSELPVAGLPSCGAPCFASLSRLSLTGHNLPVFPPVILTASRLTHLDLSPSCFEQLPEGVSALTALEELRLGRHAADRREIGGTLDARALGSLAGFPNLRSLGFATCSVLLCPSFQAAAAHPRLTRLELETSYPVRGLPCMAVLGFVSLTLEQGRPDALELTQSIVRGEGRQDSRDFLAALRAVGYPLPVDADGSESEEDWE
jgi:hypothetical protein